ncbi:MAG: hypothetical protein Q8Q39_02105 [bacterium]|nr:hypothetical protein [bacterium]
MTENREKAQERSKATATRVILVTTLGALVLAIMPAVMLAMR